MEAAAYDALRAIGCATIRTTGSSGIVTAVAWRRSSISRRRKSRTLRGSTIETGRDWLEILREWLADYGFSYVRFAYLGNETLETVLEITAQNCPGVPLILAGPRPRRLVSGIAS
jgi:hypothetical protein